MGWPRDDMFALETRKIDRRYFVGESAGGTNKSEFLNCNIQLENKSGGVRGACSVLCAQFFEPPNQWLNVKFI